MTTWRTKDGTEIPLSDLKNDHLVNIIKMLERRAPSYADQLAWQAYQFAEMTGGEMAADAATDVGDKLLDGEYEIEDVMPPVYEHLMAEARRRGLCHCDCIVDISDGPVYCEVHG